MHEVICTVLGASAGFKKLVLALRCLNETLCWC
jgi:hypothetical protein